MTTLFIIAGVVVAWLILLMIASERDRRMHAVQLRARREAERLRAQEAKTRQPITAP